MSRYMLNEYYPHSQNVIDKYISDRPSRAKVDDVIDAMCLAVVGKIGLDNGLKIVPDVPMLDSRGIKMQMAVLYL